MLILEIKVLPITLSRHTWGEWWELNPRKENHNLWCYHYITNSINWYPWTDSNCHDSPFERDASYQLGYRGKLGGRQRSRTPSHFWEPGFQGQSQDHPRCIIFLNCWSPMQESKLNYYCCLVGTVGFEPTTLWSQTRCAKPGCANLRFPVCTTTFIER